MLTAFGRCSPIAVVTIVNLLILSSESLELGGKTTASSSTLTVSQLAVPVIETQIAS
ncbi:hypothetical protein AB0758_30855 [Tolypothrix bouteillei VB521301_2]|uniref:hypothetical protein n=1 Tax=Tolypothrix bouteillei TaxID=1246981 RepID=UPI0038B44EF7